MPAKDAGRLAADDKGKAADYSGSTTVAGATFRKAADAKTRELKTEADRDHLQERDRRTEESVVADAYHGPGGKKFADKLANKESESSGRRMNKAGSSCTAKDLVNEKAMAEKAGENHLRAYEKPSEAIALSDSGGAPAAGGAPASRALAPCLRSPPLAPRLTKRAAWITNWLCAIAPGSASSRPRRSRAAMSLSAKRPKRRPRTKTLARVAVVAPGEGKGCPVAGREGREGGADLQLECRVQTGDLHSHRCPRRRALHSKSTGNTKVGCRKTRGRAYPAGHRHVPAPGCSAQSLGAPSPANGKRGTGEGWHGICRYGVP